MTTWTPDTDDCQIEISDAPETQGQFIGWANGKASKVHSSTVDVLAENQRKNRICADVEAAQAGKRYVWSIPEDRAVVVTFLDTVPSPQKTSLQTTLQTKYGVDKVRVV